MNASKENAEKSREIMERANFKDDFDRQFLDEFLKAAERKLPSEAAFKRDKKKTGR